MAPRRTTRRSAGAAADTATPSATATKPKPKTTTPATTTTTTKYESKPVPKQVTFPARRKIVKTYGHHKTRRSLPARLELEGEEEGDDTPVSEGNKRRSLRQQTLTQIDYVRSSSGSSGGEAGLLRVEVVGGEEEVKVEGTNSGDKRRTAPRKTKRRKTAGDAPIPGLERKGSSFHTQTLTQFVGKSGLRLGETGDDDELRVDDDGDEVKDLPLPVSNTPVKRPAASKKGKGRVVSAPDPHTPSNKRIKVKLEEVPSSQTTPFTPLLGHSPLKLERSPLTQKSTNLDAPLPTMETVSKIPRTLVIQDSYSVGSNSSVGFPSSSAGDILQETRDTPKKEEERTSTTQDRAPLAEIPIGSIELGVESTPAGETPTARKKRMFVEIPDSDEELESVGSTPFKTRSTQQTPRSKRQMVEDGNEHSDFKIAADPASTPRVRGAVASKTPVSTGRSDKENETPVVAVLEDEDGDENADEGMGEREGTPTPTQGRKSQAASRGSQVTPRTASQFWTAWRRAPGGDVGGFGAMTGSSAREALTELPVAVDEEPASSRDKRGGTPTVGSQFHGSMGESEGRARRATPEIEDTDETASEAEEESLDEQRPPSILRKPGSQRTPRGTSAKNSRSSPPIGTRDENGPAATSPAVRKVQIAVPDSSAEEVYKETPRKPRSHKSSPIYQRQTQTRHTQARSQYYSQFESQRVPMDVIRSLGPQTDRSDIIISLHPKIVENITNGAQDHEFRNYKFPVQVVRCWIYTDLPVGEVKYMATLGPAQEPGQLDRHTGFGNAEFNDGTSGYRYAHKLRQVYRLNNPVPLADMAEHGMGDGAPQRYRYLPLAVVGQLLANLRCPLFADEEGDEDGDDDDECGNEGGMTISQELEDQLRTDILHSTQKLQRHRPVNEDEQHEEQDEEEEEEEDIIPASQSPIKNRSTRNTSHTTTTTTTRYYQPPRTSTRGSSRSQVRPSQATTASDPSQPSEPADIPLPPPRHRARSPIRILTSSSSAAASVVGSDPASVPRPPLPDEESSGLSSVPLPGLGYGYRYGSTGTGRDGSGNGNGTGEDPPMSLSRARLLLSSSQVGVLPPDSLLLEDVRMAPPPVEVWDSDEGDV
ncbi:uncharacterized protein C8A04DRAFT_9134 [Dichotomopilus funicola]|uniref:Uncharacterized protein n=1 Tax=Dichotomopilus funicola TaxID=1934379 RepID=A0AAN6ZRJ8_9PEZI|nr:hypothetical protein C8A04DRAFT_9134 [Dichotomopilus funicola]